MRKVIVDGQYQLPEFPSVPYTPSNFWKTMQQIAGIEAVVGEEPLLPRKPGDCREDSYQASFYSHLNHVTIGYTFDGISQEATVTLYGAGKSIDVLEILIRNEHRRTGEIKAA